MKVCHFHAEHQLKSLSNCQTGWYMLNQTCYSVCPDAYFGFNQTLSSSDNSSSQALTVLYCEPCHASCARCTGPGTDNCVAAVHATIIPAAGGLISSPNRPLPSLKMYFILPVVCLIVVCAVIFAMLQACDFLRRRDGDGGRERCLNVARFRENSHIAIGVLDKPLLESDSESEDPEEIADEKQ